MGSRQATVDWIVEQAQDAGAVSARKMFGEYALYCDGKLVALICDDHLYLKPTAAGRAQLGTPEEAPPYPGAKPCFVVPGERWDEAEWMAALVRVTAAELPMPKPKRPKGPVMASGAKQPSGKRAGPGLLRRSRTSQ